MDIAGQLRQALEARLDRLRTGEDVWQALAEAGVLGIPFAEEHGGLGLRPRDAFPVLEVLGSRAVAMPYLENVLLAGLLLARVGGAHAATWLPRIASGEARVALAWLGDVQMDGWTLDGRKLLAIGAGQADAIIVTAQDGDQTKAFLLTPDQCALKDYPTIDGKRASDLTLDGVAVSADIELTVGEPLLDEVFDIASAAIASEAAAIMARLVTDTRDYCKQREQFGQAISDFQVVQHRLVNMHIETRRAEAAAALAADALELAPSDRAKAISAAKVTIADAGRFVGQNAVQLYGGMGMTEELTVSALFKRLTVIESEFGTRDHHLARYMAAG